MTLVGKLAQQTGAAIVLLRAERLPRGQGFVVHQSALSQTLPTDATQAAALINQGLEALIRESPAQYLWSYNRYKTPRSS
jgi:KDO2-lipid IV(A) lauroyltransferase